MRSIKLRIIPFTIVSLIALFFFTPPAVAASEYDDLVEKVTTKTLIHHIDNYYGRSCGSSTDDYAERWLQAFRQGNSYSGNPAKHQEAVRSLEKAISSPNGAYAVIYEQQNNHDNTSNVAFLRIFWTEDGRPDYTYNFYKNGQNKGIYLARKNGSNSRLYTAAINSPKLARGAMNCAPEYAYGYDETKAYMTDAHISTGSYKKLFTSTFNVNYPEGYEGRRLPNYAPDLSQHPVSSGYDDFVDKITTERLVNYLKERGRFTCGPTDYSDRWLSVFEYPKKSSSWHTYHRDYMDSLLRAIAGNGAYAIAHPQAKTNNTIFDSNAVVVYWSERRDDFEIRFYGDAPARVAVIHSKWGKNGKLYGMVAGSTGPLQGRGGCEVEFLQGNYSDNAIPIARFNESFIPYYSGNGMKLFKSTFDVRYPYGYKGPKMPGSPAKLDYLALGDSFSSGEGDTERNGATGEKYYRYGTDVNEDKKKGRLKEKCHVSTRSYPYRLARQMGLGSGPSAEWASVACGGATIYDMNGDNAEGYEGQDSPLGRLHGQENKKVLQGVALNEMIPGRVKQIEFVKKYQPKVITLTAGGNDAGFGEKLKACLGWRSLNDCTWAKTEWRSRLKNDLLDQFDKLRSLYNELKIASSNKSKIYVLGYPQFVNGAPDAQCRNTFSLNPREREMIANSITYYNSIIRQATKAAGVKYVGVENAFGNHWLCGDNDSHVTAITNIFGANGNEQQESFHPNAKGHADIAHKFKRELGGVSPVDYEICPGGATNCPDGTATKDKISAPPYFNIASEQEDIKFTHYQLTDGTATKVEEKWIEIKTSRWPYKPRKKVYVKIYSEPRDLGEIETDENGTPDKNQPCGAFIQAASQDEDLDGIDDACDPEVTEPILYSARNGISKLGEDEERRLVCVSSKGLGTRE